MADIQKQLTTQATVSERPVAPPSSAPGDIVRAAGQIATIVSDRRARQEADRLEEDLTQLGREAFAVRNDATLDQVTDRFKELRAAKEQGLLSDTFLQIEAEKILKESITRHPQYKDRFRQRAYEVTGFDPTGAQVQALYGMGQKQSDRQTYAEKQIEEASYIAQYSGVPVETVMRLQAQSAAAKLQADLVAQQAALGSFSGRDVFNATLNETDTYVNDMFRSVVEQVNSGGIRSPERVVADVQLYMTAQKQALRNRLAHAGISPSATEVGDYMAQIDRQWQPILELAKSGSMDEILSSQASSLANAMTIQGWNAMGEVALINKMYGQEGVRHYHLTLDKYSNPGELDLLKRGDSLLSRHLNSIDDAKRGAAAAYKRVMGIQDDNTVPTQLTPEQQAVSDRLADRVMYDVVKEANMSEAEKDARLSYARQHGQKFKVLGAYMQRGARAAASEEEVRFVTQTFQEEYQPLVERIAADMARAKGTPGEFSIVYRNGKVEKIYTNRDLIMSPRTAGEAAASAFYQNPQTTGDLQRLQMFSEGLANGWENDLGVRPLTFVGDTLKKINDTATTINTTQRSLEDAIGAYERNPTPEMWERVRAADPSFADEVERTARSNSRVPGDNRE